MKIWSGFGSEHSMNLVMIGRFTSSAEAEVAHDVINQLKAAVRAEEEAGRLSIGKPADEYSDEMLRQLLDLNISSVGPRELEQFLYEMSVSRDDDTIVVTTDEIDIQAVLKVLLGRGARLDVYSAHDHTGTGHGRGA